MKKIITSIACLLLLSTITPEANAQKNYNTGLGIRLGYAYGLSVKHFLSESVSFEGIVSSRYYGRGRIMVEDMIVVMLVLILQHYFKNIGKLETSMDSTGLLEVVLILEPMVMTIAPMPFLVLMVILV